MLEREKAVYFQIHKNGQAVDGRSYPTLEGALAVLQEAAQGGEITEVDAFDRILRRYTLEDCRTAQRKSRQGMTG
jgi:hypothetical protein